MCVVNSDDRIKQQPRRPHVVGTKDDDTQHEKFGKRFLERAYLLGDPERDDGQTAEELPYCRKRNTVIPKTALQHFETSEVFFLCFLSMQQNIRKKE